MAGCYVCRCRKQEMSGEWSLSSVERRYARRWGHRPTPVQLLSQVDSVIDLSPSALHIFGTPTTGRLAPSTPPPHRTGTTHQHE